MDITLYSESIVKVEEKEIDEMTEVCPKTLKEGKDKEKETVGGDQLFVCSVKEEKKSESEEEIEEEDTLLLATIKEEKGERNIKNEVDLEVRSETPSTSLEEVEQSSSHEKNFENVYTHKPKKRKTNYNEELFQKALRVLTSEESVSKNKQFGEYVAMELDSLHYDHNRRLLKRELRRMIINITEKDDDEYNSTQPMCIIEQTNE